MIGQLVSNVIASSKRMREKVIDVLGLIGSIPNTLRDISKLSKHPLSLTLDERETYFKLPKRLEKQWEKDGTLERHRKEIENFLEFRNEGEEHVIDDNSAPNP